MSGYPAFSDKRIGQSSWIDCYKSTLYKIQITYVQGLFLYSNSLFKIKICPILGLESILFQN